MFGFFVGLKTFYQKPQLFSILALLQLCTSHYIYYFFITMKRFLTLALGMAITFSIPNTHAAGGNDFTDVDHQTDYYQSINFTEEQSIFKGNEDGTFDPTGELNRAEMATLLIRLEFLDDEIFHPLLPQLECEKKAYPDVVEDSWYEVAVYRAQCTGLMTGDSGGTFRPDDSLTAAEVLTVFYRAYNKYSDDVNGEKWYMPGLNWSEKMKIIPPTIKGLNHQVTRAEMARMFEKLWQHEKGYNIGDDQYLTAQEVLNGLPDVHMVTPIENPFVLELEAKGDLDALKKWSANGSVPDDILAEHPLPWTFEGAWKEGLHVVEITDAKDQLVIDNQSENATPLFKKDLLNHYRYSFGGQNDFIYPSEWKKITKNISTIPNEYAWTEGQISESENWVTLPYRDGYVGALNLDTGAFILHQIQTPHYSQVRADDEGVFYAENNAWGCLSDEILATGDIKLMVSNTPCRIVYESASGEVTALDENLSPFLDGMYNYTLRMTEEHLFVFDSVWECYQFCPPRVSIYKRLNDGTVEHQESWNYLPNTENVYIEDPKFFTFGHYTEDDGWTTYSIAADPYLDFGVDWEGFWANHPELTTPYSLLEL